MNAGEQAGIDDIGSAAVDDRLLVPCCRMGFFSGDEGRADIGEIGAHRLRCEYRASTSDGTGQDERPFEPGADFLHQCEGRLRSGMTASARSNRDQAISAFLDGLAGETIVDHVMKNETAPPMDGGIDLRAGAKGGDYERNLVPFQDREILL